MAELKMSYNAEKREKQEGVAKGVVQKKTFMDRLKKNISGMEKISLREYILEDVVIPGIFNLISDVVSNTTNTISDAICDATDIMLWGEKGTRKKKKDKSGKISYNSIFDDKRDRKKKHEDDKIDWDDVVFETREKAKAVRKKMYEKIEDAPDVGVSIADFLEWSEFDSDFTDEHYGWKKLPEDLEIVRVRNMYKILLPKPRLLS